MSFFEDASLVMIPSGVKESKLYSIKPTDGTGDFTFTRGTDTATRVNSAGNIEKETQNLLLQSNQFNTTWTLNNASVTGGQSGYDGSNDAWELDVTTAAGHLQQSLTAVSGVHTISLYAKQGTLDFLMIYARDAGGSNDAEFYFDLANGVTGSTKGANPITLKMTDVGGGWYRCEGASKGGFDQYRIYGSNVDNSVTGTGNIYIQDAQLEQGLVARTYIDTTTAAVYAGITDNLPRLDYSGGASCPSLLLESQRTNIQPNSEYVNAYTKSRSTITTNATTSPEGVSNASKVIPLSTSTGWSGINAPNYSFTSGQTYTLSVFAKAGEYNYCQVGGSTPAFNGSFATINLTNGVVEHESGITASTEDYGNGWYRISFTHTAIATASSPIGFFAVYSTAVSSRLVAQVGDNVSGVYIFGWMAELGSYPTSYIPTMGSAVTRSKEGAQVTSVSDLIGQTQGTLFAEVDSFGVGEVANRILGVSNGSAAERVIILTRSNGYRFIVTNSSVNNVDYTNYTTTNGVHKLAMTYDANEVRIFVDGAKVTTDSSVTLPSSLNSVHIGKVEITDSYNNNFGGSAKQALVFKTALTDAEAIALTTL